MVSYDLEVRRLHIDCGVTEAGCYDRLAQLDGEHLHLDVDYLSVVDLDLYLFVLSRVENDFVITRDCTRVITVDV